MPPSTRDSPTLSTDPLPSTDAAVVNISRDVVPLIVERLACERILTSGYLVSESPELPGYRREARRDAEGWVADLHVRTK